MRFGGLLREVAHAEGNDGLGSWEQGVGMAGDIGSLWSEPGEAIHEALSDALFDDALGFWKCFGAGDAYDVEAERVAVFFDGSSVEHAFVFVVLICDVSPLIDPECQADEDGEIDRQDDYGMQIGQV